MSKQNVNVTFRKWRFAYQCLIAGISVALYGWSVIILLILFATEITINEK